MIGIIVTGHGNFASGLLSAIKLTAGTPEKFLTVDFLQEDSADELELKLKSAITSLSECEEGILIFTDVMDGQPYKISTELIQNNTTSQQIELISGTNLGMLMEANMARGFMKSLTSLVTMACEIGVSQIHPYNH